jgi:acetylornithine deacetylase
MANIKKRQGEIMENETKTLVLKKIDEKSQEIIEFAQKLVQTPSDAGNEGAVQKIIAKRLEKLGLELDIFDIDVDLLSKHPGFVPLEDYRMSYEGRPNVVGISRGSGGGKSLILMGHVDTVPVENPSLWKHDPYSGEIEDGKLYGRGSLDQKGGVAAQNMAVECLLEAGITLRGDVIIENVIEEEAGGNGATACAQKGYKADAGIYTEPSGFDFIGVSNRGAQFFRIVVPGVATGIEAKWGSPNALEKAIRLYKAVDDFSLLRQSEAVHLPSYELYKIDLDKIESPMARLRAKAYLDNIVPTGICKIHAGTWPSSMPEACVMEGSIECLPGEDIQEIKQRFKEYLQRVAETDEYLKENPPKIEWFGLWFESCQTDIEHPIIGLIQSNCKKIVGKTPIPKGGGGSDLRCLVKYANTPSVIFGGGTGGNAHGIDEYLDVESLINSTKILALTILDWCS